VGGLIQKLDLFVSTSRREMVVAGMLAFILFFVGTASSPVIGRDESRFAQAAREMTDRDEFVVPTFAGEGRYHKPILVYWCTAASYAAFGINERTARLPSNLAGALSVMLLAWAARRRYGRGFGLLAGMLLATTLAFGVEARICTADMVVFLPTLAVMLSFERLLRGDGDRRHAMVFWIGIGAAILAKGPIAPAWVLSTALTLWALGRRWRSWELVTALGLMAVGVWRLGPIPLMVPAVVAGWGVVRSAEGRATLARLNFGWGLPVALAVTLPWAVAAAVATDGAFLREAIGKHVVSRSLSSFEGHGFFPGFYLVTALLVAFPWFAQLIEALGRRGRAAFAAGELRFLVAWLAGPMILLELVQTKLVHYWMPSYPAGVLLVVGWLAWAAKNDRGVGRAARAATIAGGFLVAVVPAGVAIYAESPRLVAPGLLAGGILVASVTAGAAIMARRPVRGVVVLTAGSAAFLVWLAVVCLPLFGTELLGPRAARRAVELRRPDERIVVFKVRDDDLFFYLPVDVSVCWGADCMAAHRRVDRRVLGVARERDFEDLVRKWTEVSLLEVDRIDGIDAGHVRRETLVLFRPVAGPDDPISPPEP
jgi:4-amino-4-deoxy-L-arabinose transferase-like glycosyltransferase